jgi:hypothetical protein
MIKWLTGLFHRHTWTIIKEVQLQDQRGDIYGTRYYLQCTHCGTVKRT